MRYYGGFTINQLFSKDDPARKIFEMAFGQDYDRQPMTAGEFRGDKVWGLQSSSFSEKAEWEKYKATIPYAEFTEVKKS